MENVISLQEKKNKKLDPKADFKTQLNAPLNLGLPKASEPTLPPMPVHKKPTALSKARWKLKKLREFIFDAAIRPIRDRIYRKAGDKLLGELMTLAAQLNRPNFHVFVNFSAHVNSVQVDVHPGGWVSGNDPKAKDKDSKRIRVLEGHLPGHYKYGKMKPKDIRAAMKIIKSLSQLNRLHKS